MNSAKTVVLSYCHNLDGDGCWPALNGIWENKNFGGKNPVHLVVDFEYPILVSRINFIHAIPQRHRYFKNLGEADLMLHHCYLL